MASLVKIASYFGTTWDGYPNSDRIFICSECKEGLGCSTRMNFCPMCGVKFDEPPIARDDIYGTAIYENGPRKGWTRIDIKQRTGGEFGLLHCREV